MSLSVLRVKKNLEKYLRTRYSTRTEREIVGVKSLTKGWETELFSFDFRFKEEGEQKEENLILRIYPGKDVQNKIKWEFNVLVALFNEGYPVPKRSWSAP